MKALSLFLFKNFGELVHRWKIRRNCLDSHKDLGHNNAYNSYQLQINICHLALIKNITFRKYTPEITKRTK